MLLCVFCACVLTPTDEHDRLAFYKAVARRLGAAHRHTDGAGLRRGDEVRRHQGSFRRDRRHPPHGIWRRIPSPATPPTTATATTYETYEATPPPEAAATAAAPASSNKYTHKRDSQDQKFQD